MWRRLFKRFEQRIERRCRKHVDFVNDIDLVLALRRREVNLVAQVTDIINRCVRCRVNFNEIEKAILVDGFTKITFITRSPDRVGMGTIDCLRQKTCHRSLPRPTRTSKQIRMTDSIRINSILQSGNDVILPHHGCPILRSVFSVKCLSHFLSVHSFRYWSLMGMLWLPVINGYGTVYNARTNPLGSSNCASSPEFQTGSPNPQYKSMTVFVPEMVWICTAPPVFRVKFGKVNT